MTQIPGIRPRKFAREKKQIQKEIVDLYGDYVEEVKGEMCTTCEYALKKGKKIKCGYSLLPVALDKSKCPYFKKGKK
jgi:hypothetical protein